MKVEEVTSCITVVNSWQLGSVLQFVVGKIVSKSWFKGGGQRCGGQSGQMCSNGRWLVRAENRLQKTLPIGSFRYINNYLSRWTGSLFMNLHQGLVGLNLDVFIIHISSPVCTQGPWEVARASEVKKVDIMHLQNELWALFKLSKVYDASPFKVCPSPFC